MGFNLTEYITDVDFHYLTVHNLTFLYNAPHSIAVYHYDLEQTKAPATNLTYYGDADHCDLSTSMSNPHAHIGMRLNRFTLYDATLLDLHDNSITIAEECGFTLSELETRNVSSWAYRSVILSPNKFTSMAHAISDSLPMLTLTPKFITMKSVFLYSSQYWNYIPLILSALEFTDVVYTDWFVFAHELYIHEPWPCAFSLFLAQQRFRPVINKLFQVEHAPRRYVFIQRTNSHHRVIANYHELLTQIRASHAEIEWEERTHHTFAHDAAYFGNIKFMMGVHGADFANVIFLPERSVAIEIQVRDAVFMYQRVCVAIGVHGIVAQYRNITRLGAMYMSLDAEMVLDIVNLGLEKLDQNPS